MINSFENYLKLGKVKRKTPDPEESRSLYEKSKRRLNFIKTKQVNEDNAPFILEDAYKQLEKQHSHSCQLKDTSLILMRPQFYRQYNKGGDLWSFKTNKYLISTHDVIEVFYK